MDLFYKSLGGLVTLRALHKMAGASLPSDFFDSTGDNQGPTEGGELAAFLAEVETAQQQAETEFKEDEDDESRLEDAEVEDAVVQHAYLNKVARLMIQKAALEEGGIEVGQSAAVKDSEGLAEMIADPDDSRTAGTTSKVEEMVIAGLKINDSKNRKRKVDEFKDDDLISFSF